MGSSSSNTWLIGLQLLSVQPACLRADSYTYHQHATLHGSDEGAAVAHRQQEAHHDVLLHLQAIMFTCSTTERPAQDTADTRTTVVPAVLHQQLEQQQHHSAGAAPSLPLPLAAAQLQVLVLSRQMQLLHRQQTSLLQMLQQQGQQQQGQLESEQLPSGSSSSGTWSVYVDWHTTVPCQPNDRLLDCMQLMVMVGGSSSSSSSSSSSTSSSTSSIPQPAAGVAAPAGTGSNQAEVGGSAATLETEETEPAVAPMKQAPAAAGAAAAAAAAWGVVADVPLLVMPAAAQQEVQQLLLPAMRQEVQAAQQMQLQQQQQHEQRQEQPQQVEPEQQQHEVSQLLNTSNLSLLVEHAAWVHYCQLSRDIATVLQLSSAVNEAAAAAAGDTADGSTSSVTVAAGSITSPAAETAVEAAIAAATAAAGRQPSGDAAAGSALVVVAHNVLPSAAAEAASPAAALQHLAEVLLFPLLLPFLATQGLHNMLRLLLMCLPRQLQLQWRQQQPAHTWLPAPSSTEGISEAVKPAAAAAAVGSAQDAGVSSSNSSEATSYEKAGSSGPEKQQQAVAAGTEAAPVGGSSANMSGRAEATAATAATTAAAAAAAAAASVPWYLPLTQFRDRAVEQRYVTWKHNSLLHLDYGAVMFCAFYLLTLLRRTMSQPTTVFYLLYMIIKTMPHVPLALGLRQTYLRHREQWLVLVAPVTAIVMVCLALPAVARGQAAMLLPNRAYRAYWTGRGELPTSILRPFLQHMRVRPYIVYAVVDAALTAWVFGQVFGVWAAVRRLSFAAAMSIGLCWGLDLHMRRRFVGALARQQQQLQLQQQ